MAAATITHDTLLPRPPGGLAQGAALAVLAHAGLLLALTYATDWRTQAPVSVSAELWAAVPQVAAPPPAALPAPLPAPPPPPPAPAPAKAEPPPRADADIATERAEKRKAEAEKKRLADEAQKTRELKSQAQAQAQRQAEATKQQQAEAERAAKAEQKRREVARELLADEARLAEQREANLRRMMGQAGPNSPSGTGNPGSRGTAAQDAAPSAAYSARLAALIRSNIVFTGSVPDNAVAEVEVRATASGTVLARRLVKSSGHADWDDAVLRAIDRTGRLPRDDTDGRVPPVILIAFKPRD